MLLSCKNNKLPWYCMEPLCGCRLNLICINYILFNPLFYYLVRIINYPINQSSFLKLCVKRDLYKV